MEDLGKNNNAFITNVYFYLILVMLALDLVEGVTLLLGGQVNLSVIPRVLIILLLLLGFISKSHRFSTWLLLYLISILFLVSFFRGGSYTELRWLISILACFLLVFCQINFTSKQRGFLLFALLVYLSVNIFLPYLGVGKAQYSDGSGSIGLVVSGNELSMAVLISAMSIMLLSKMKNRIPLMVFVSLLAGLKGTKVAILGVPIVLILFSNRFSFGRMFAPLSVLLLCIVGAIYSGVLDRFIYYSQRLDIITLIFSSRNIWAEEAIYYMYESFGLIDWLLGAGYEQLILVIGKTIEIDPLDSLFVFGAGGVALSLYIMVKALACYAVLSRFRLILFISFIVFLSVLSGHILYGTTFVYLLPLIRGGNASCNISRASFK